jgi:hypothetical protein
MAVLVWSGGPGFEGHCPSGGAIWDDTICPDLTNSTSDSGTGVGHGS